MPEHGRASTQAEVGAGDPAAVADNLYTLSLRAIHNFNPSRPPTHKIQDIIQSKYDAPYLSWKKIPKEIRDMWFREFQKDFRWFLEHGTRIITNFERKGSTCLRDMFIYIRSPGNIQYALEREYG
ncbi:hypothetical protein M5K25_003715 [Dendrobium thyrsiflorum]|uniref:Uncharacterized protein n=1 Tax=Dendrobium thyrsiflorum TaxID=117978 RepID=A0ABD0VJQ7_DENTH